MPAQSVGVVSNFTRVKPPSSSLSIVEEIVLVQL